jgi:hypothetical protein
VALHTGQLCTSVPHVSTPLPLQRVWPVVQEVPQLPQAPPLQKLVQVCMACHEVQPLASATHASAVLPAQRSAPAVQVLLQLWQLPPWHRLPLPQVAACQVVHPDSRFHEQVSTPVAVQREAPRLHAWQLPH